MKRSTTLLALGLMLLAGRPVAAQEGDTDRLGTRIDWGTAQVLLTPSATLGMHLSVWTTEYAHVEGSHGMGAGFQPDSALAWINSVNLVVHPTADPRGPNAELVTPALHAADGDSIRVMRRANGARWEKRIVILLDASGSGSRPLDILVEPKEADRFVRGILREASLSGYNADSVAAGRNMVISHDAPDGLPRLLHAGARYYPDHRLRGGVTVRFVIDTTGHPDMATYQAIAADHLIFADWARPLIAGSTFAPGTVHGHPVPVMIQQNINFIP